MAVLTNTGRTAMAAAIMAQPLHFAWGSGDPDWDTLPAPATQLATALTAELGRIAPTLVEYCAPDEAGAIGVPSGRYAVSSAPTRYLHLQFQFQFEDEPEGVIREGGLFMNTALAANLPGGQRYFPPADVDSPGTLLAIERFPKITRSVQSRQTFEFVLVI
ncbi:hypothetical protein [uncultured Thiodictyon sp.]|uniref:hypothetical protein n=1 Tax=uncultured Thiodictyon sp. TaxID=1846217 RepID=UPI0025D82ACE|nr:hypothetical protein [uncultured Thiodictyon sp.]